MKNHMLSKIHIEGNHPHGTKSIHQHSLCSHHRYRCKEKHKWGKCIHHLYILDNTHSYMLCNHCHLDKQNNLKQSKCIHQKKKYFTRGEIHLYISGNHQRQDTNHNWAYLSCREHMMKRKGVGIH